MANLEEMDKAELVQLARESGVPVDGRASKNAVIAALAEKLTQQPIVQQEEDAPKKKSVEYYCSEEEIRSVLPKNVTIEFHGDDTWTMTSRTAIDSGTMRQPLERIRRCAMYVSRATLPPIRKGSDGPLIMEGNHWDKVG
jgi:hypothetical protein